jgi:hypothetical protein
MIHRVDDRLRLEAARYRLAFTCERCVEFDAERDRCSFGYPSEPHKRIDLATASEVTFCKAFELG